MEYSASEITLGKSSILHPNDGRGFFAARPVGEGIIVKYYYRTLVYDSSSSGRSCFKIYVERIMQATRKKFLK